MNDLYNQQQFNPYQDNESFITKLAYKLGAKNKKQAEMMLLVIIGVAIVGAFFLFTNSGPKEVPPPDAGQNQTL